ncbi:hypothetical protein PSACC_00499 [Paramicrosporidium saccamoebae]|uniref:Uncharacterized protein n=1 Tax=Paramicrosporidium saccamoebae TaxID=1246581 RepID=A0A2H9TPG2_9FUNG|nr:hypothetical protein PSACC_00499 [Paramicrosporidium saccamoebae]
MSATPNETTLADLETLADNFSSSKTVVDSWLKLAGKKLPATSNIQAEYNDTNATRPLRLGIGAKPSADKKQEHESIFSNYKLKMQLTGKEQLGEGKQGKLRSQLGPMNTSKRPATKPLRPVNEEESRSQSVGKGTKAAATASAVPSYVGGHS